jgi:Tol biopolymer transport system component
MYSTDVQDSNIWLTPLGQAGGTSRSRMVVPATHDNSDPRVSPDGSKIVYLSYQSGFTEIWTSNLDGTQATQLTNLGGAGTGSATWAPDGQRIAFDSRVEGRPHIYLRPAGGGHSERLTDGLSDNYLPAWSKDGRWIYYCSSRSGTIEVWRQPAAGGTAEQVTQRGGWSPAESPDGRSLFYQRSVPAGWSLRQRILATGVEREILPALWERAFVVARDGVYYIPLPGPDGRFTIQFLDFESNASRTIATITNPMNRPLSLSPDGSFLLHSQIDRSGQDLMLLENFH